MILFDPPIPLVGHEPLVCDAHDGASYVLADGRTLWAPAPAGGATRESIAAVVVGLLASPPAPPSPLATGADIKTEARRRILAIAPEWKQANLTARILELTRDHGQRVPSWPAEAIAEDDAAQAVWAQIKAIRAHSDALESSPPALWALTAAGWPY